LACDIPQLINIYKADSLTLAVAKEL